jgi:hypothetical protein
VPLITYRPKNLPTQCNNEERAISIVQIEWYRNNSFVTSFHFVKNR